ncbi:MAG: hypothetical protein J5523_03020 [Muribaculaceae bacterium]|nr:hypothetical protein [Muribaculaceae bacterium]
MKTKGIITSIVAVAALLLCTSTAAKEKTAASPNYVKALGFNDAVKTIGAYSDEWELTEGEYCTYEFDREGRLISYDQSETIEGAYGYTTYFGPDGLPTHAKSVFINWWELDADGNPPITYTDYKIRREDKGNVTLLFIENGDEPDKQVKVTRDDEGRIIEVDNITSGVVNRYRYFAGENVPCYYDGTIAFPQVDMVGGLRPTFLQPQALPDHPDNYQCGLWQFEISYFE